MVSKDLIERFFKQQCSPEEVDTVHQFFQEHPEALDEYMNETADSPEGLSSKDSARLWKKIAGKTVRNQPVRTFWYYAAAAAVIVFTVAGWFLFQKNPGAKEELHISKVQEVQKITKTNNGHQVLSFHLSDGSLVQLMPNSSLSFREGFEKERRDLWLKGEALFFVAKDKTRPFTVYSDALATVAVGTEFRVTSYPGSGEITVQLNEGRVAVRLTHNTPSSKNNKYLKPGEMLIYDKLNGAMHVTGNRKTANKQLMKKNTNNIKGFTGNNWYVFGNQPLSDVLDQLSVLYNQQIRYSKEELGNSTFIGKVDKTDSLERILQSIALLNQLKLTKTPSGFELKK